MSVAAKKFMSPLAQKPEALAWLQDTPQDQCPAWMRALRATGAEVFASTGLPTTAWEGWQHTNLRPLAQTKFHYSKTPVMCSATGLPAPLLEDALRVVVVNGQYQQHLSALSPDIQVMQMTEAFDGVEERLASVGDLAAMPLKALNTAYLRDGFVLRAEKDVARPVEILFYNTGTIEKPAAIYPRMLYWLGKNAGLTVLEHHCGTGVYLANSVTDMILEPDSRLKFYRLMDESSQAFHMSHATVQMQKNACFEGFSMALGATVARQEFYLNMLDSAISSSMNGIYLLNSQQIHDFTVQVDHFEPESKSEQYFKGVVDGQARAIFQGKIHVRRSAQKSNGYQRHHALLLSSQAEACAKPELEIYADDVRCSHGATSGHLDPVALFYLRSRGIPEAEARALLIESFLNEGVEKVTFDPVREIYRQKISAWLHAKSSLYTGERKQATPS